MVTSRYGNALFKIQQRNLINRTLPFGLDEFHYKKMMCAAHADIT